jgi:hypothetical protein
MANIMKNQNTKTYITALNEGNNFMETDIMGIYSSIIAQRYQRLLRINLSPDVKTVLSSAPVSLLEEIISGSVMAVFPPLLFFR